MKKILSMMLSLVLVLSMGTVGFAADNQDASFSKTYKITNEGTSNPAETFKFKFTADQVTDSNKNLSKDNMPEIPDSTVTYGANTATTEGLEKTVAVALKDVEWPGVGVYYYKVNEVAGNTAGVTYDNHEAWLKVTVAYDETRDIYYTAFVTLNFKDEDKDGITDGTKTDGFTNEYSAGSLAIKKNVTGNMGDQEAYFAVKVTLNGETSKTYLESYSVSGGSYDDNPTTIAIGTETTFYLKHNETITIENLPYGVTYTVVEDNYTSDEKGGYDAPEYAINNTNVDESVEGASATINSASDTVTIKNNKGITVDTGISLDSMPYILILAVACIGLFMFFAKKRMMRED